MKKIIRNSLVLFLLFLLSASLPAEAFSFFKRSDKKSSKTNASQDVGKSSAGAKAVPSAGIGAKGGKKSNNFKSSQKDKSAKDKEKPLEDKKTNPAEAAKEAKKYYAQALKTQDLNEQIKLYSKALQLAPAFTAAYHRRADAYKEQGRIKKAMADYSKAIALSPKDAFKYYARALAYMQQQNYASAAEDLTKAVALKKNYDYFYYQRAQAFMALEKYKSALKDIDKIKDKEGVKNNPALEGELIFMEGKIQFALYNYDAARRDFEHILARNPDDTQSLVYLGRIELANERYDEAVSYFSKALNRSGDDENALRLRAAAYKETKQFDQALEDYTALLSLKEDYAHYNRRGLVYEQIDDWPMAAQDYSKAIELNPKWAIAYNNRGYAYMKMKEYKKAFNDFETSLKLLPLRTTYINLAGYYWTVKKDKKDMYQNLDHALKYNFRDFDSLYDDSQKGWLFKNINNTVEFRSFIAPYSSEK